MLLPELLLVASPGFPILLATLWPLARLRRVCLAAVPWAAVPALVLALLPGADGVEVIAPALFTGVRLSLDAPGRAFLLLTALLWVAAGVFARSYHREDPHGERFFGFFVLTMAGNLGLTVAGDILSFYLFFALMTFAGYGLVVQRRNGEAWRAGRVYMVMAILGEACILAAVLCLGRAAPGAAAFGPELQTAWAILGDLGWATGVAALAVAGFGVKAGLVPLHLWLPLAHPVAPTAASALLSGSMIQAGVLAWLRYLPAGLALPEMGAALGALGVVSILYGAGVGLAQDDPKTVLAYSSVSQMGYMALGVGLLLRSPGWAGAALVPVVFFAIHHGIAKGALFLSVGVADRTRGSTPSRSVTLVLAVTALPALILAGAPMTTGARAKGSLKAGLKSLAPGWYETLEPVLLLASVGTTLLMIRFLITLRRRMTRSPRRVARETGSGRPDGVRASTGLLLPWVALVAVGAAGSLWLPLAFTPPPGIAVPAPGEGLAEAAGPLLVGLLVGWGVLRGPGLPGGIRNLRLPPGDLVVFFEGLTRRLRALPWGILEQQPGRRVRWAFHRIQLWIQDRVDRAATGDVRLARGPALGLLLTGLAVALAMLLSMG